MRCSLRLAVVAFVLVSLLASCTSEDSSKPPGSSGTAIEQGVGASTAPFGQGCPKSEQSLARRLDQSAGRMPGARVVGDTGDYLLANDKAAFVISAPVSAEMPQRTWYHYGGIVVDAGPVDGCKMASPDQIDEIGLVLGTLNPADFTSSILRSFRADKVEVVNDGADGKPAVVRASGVDDTFQLIEYQLIRVAVEAGKEKARSKPFGVRIEVDYVLDPGDPVLKTTMRIVADTDGHRSLMGAALVTWGDEVEPIHRPDSKVDVSGFELDLGVPWQLAQGTKGSYAFAASKATQAVASISGVNAFIDVNQALQSPLVLEKAGDTKDMTFLLSVSPTDANRATQALLRTDAELGPGAATQVPVEGTTVDGSGAPVGDVRIDIQMRRDGGEWGTYDVASTDASGRFTASIAVLDDAKGAKPDIRLRFVAKGRNPVLVEVPTSGGASPPAIPDRVTLGPPGVIDASIVDGAGKEIPARLTLWKGGELAQTIDTPHSAELAVPPGTYDVVVSHGFEYDRVESQVVVPEGGKAQLQAKLERSVDTAGWVTLDTHVHSAPSTDSSVLPERRYLDAAVSGVEVVVNTNHETIQDLGAQLKASGLSSWVNAITGQEVTASLPEHTTMYAVTPDGSVRGGPPMWYGHGLGEIFALEKQRGAGVRGLNHPTGYLELIRWDPVTNKPGIDDASFLGLDPGSKTWSWDFEQVEVQNGAKPVLRSNADSEGLFDFWQGAFNHGKRITGVGASDTHDLDIGEVMTYVRVPDDNPASITPEQIMEAIKAGRAVISTGAFADVKVAGAGPGELAPAKGTAVEVSLRVQAARGIDVSSVQVFANCDLVATVPIDSKDSGVRYDGVVKVDVPADANITVLGFGASAMPRPFRDSSPSRVPRFTTNPVFVDANGNGTFDPPGDKSCSYPRG